MLECGCNDDYSCRSCQYYATTINEEWLDDWLWNGSSGEMLAGSGSSLNCLSSILEKCESNGRTGAKWNGTDDCVAELFYKKANASYSIGDSGYATVSHRCANESLDEGGNSCVEKTTFIMDENCNVTDADPSSICGDLEINFIVSPISLLWDGAQRLQHQPSLVDFQLQPGKEGWYTWHASETAPLLVYDPVHSTRVTSATQLFGDYTFGGPENLEFIDAGLSSIPNQLGKWKHGFEPLALLDTNGDQKLTGEELEPLGLWFDRNKNGSVEDGEMKRAREEGLTALFFRPDTMDDRGHLYATLGFERQINGQTVQGTAVDWYSTYYPSKLRAITETQRKYPSEPQ